MESIQGRNDPRCRYTYIAYMFIAGPEFVECHAWVLSCSQRWRTEGRRGVRLAEEWAGAKGPRSASAEPEAVCSICVLRHVRNDLR